MALFGFLYSVDEIRGIYFMGYIVTENKLVSQRLLRSSYKLLKLELLESGIAIGLFKKKTEI